MLEDWIRMDRLLPHPRTPVGYRRDGRPIYPILGADPTDPSNQQLPPSPSTDPSNQPLPPSPNTDPAVPPAQVPDQETLTRLLAREKQQGERAAIRKLVEQLGFAKTDDLTTFVQQQRDAQAAQLSEIERREQAAEEKLRSAETREAQALAREHVAIRRAALGGLGAAGDDLEDAVLLIDRALQDQPDADEAAVAAAAEQLKERRPELFGQARATVPPAPGGSPAGGPPKRGGIPPRRGAAGLEMARRRGLVSD
ncbi:hypothetical protein [Streptomyces canus]|uniref:hypothetical protein n=1 Tax=Streptomyces canus TaxID=58343 RepID=UPI002257105D|nr:hypothetical protein [Streptomyces canus]MCX4858364.1 hypothetical protein [Streptomyces canus]